MFFSKYMPCPDCGASVERDERFMHTCNPERRAEYVFFQLRPELELLEQEFATWLDTCDGRFETWLARRKVKKGDESCA